MTESTGLVKRLRELWFRFATETETDATARRNAVALEAASRIEALEAEVARLREALEPFADQANFCISDTAIIADDRELYITNPHDILDFEKATFTVGDLRRARAALGGKP